MDIEKKLKSVANVVNIYDGHDALYSASKAYIDLINKYKQKHKLSNVFFQTNIESFFYYNKRLYLLGQSMPLNLNLFRKLMEQAELPVIETDTLLIKNIFELLKIIVENNKRHPYDILKDYYVNISNKSIELFVYPDRHFYVFDNNLLFKDGFCITKKLLDKYTESKFNVKFSSSHTKIIVKYLTDGLLIKPLQEPIKCIERLPFFRMNMNPSSLEYISDQQILKYNKNISKSEHIYCINTISTNKKWSDYYPINFMRTLFLLTNGDSNTLFDICYLFFNIVSKKAISKKLTVILCCEQQKELLWLVLYNIFQDNIIKKSLKNVCNKSNIHEMTEYKFDNKNINITDDINLPKDENIQNLKLIVSGKPLKANTDCMGKKTYINTMHHIYCTQDEKVADELKKVYKANIIKLPKLNSELAFNFNRDDENLLEFNKEELEWISTVFMANALKTVAERQLKIKNDAPINPKSKPENTITNFINDCCISKIGYEVYDYNFYDKYYKYCLNNYGFVPYTKILLVKEIKAMNKYVHKKLRHNAKDSKYGFTGLAIDNERLDIFLNLPIPQRKIDEDISLLVEYLKSMNKTFNEIK